MNSELLHSLNYIWHVNHSDCLRYTTAFSQVLPTSVQLKQQQQQWKLTGWILDANLALTCCQHQERQSEFQQSHSDHRLVPFPLLLLAELLQHCSHATNNHHNYWNFRRHNSANICYFKVQISTIILQNTTPLIHCVREKNKLMYTFS